MTQSKLINESEIERLQRIRLEYYSTFTQDMKLLILKRREIVKKYQQNVYQIDLEIARQKTETHGKDTMFKEQRKILEARK